jgi:transposase
MGHIAEIRRRHFTSGENISELAKSLNLSRPTVRKALKAEAGPAHQRKSQPTPKPGGFKGLLAGWLEKDARLPKRQRRTAQRLFECLQVEGYRGSYGPVQRHVLAWKRQPGKPAKGSQAFVPLTFPAGGTCQFDWCHDDCMDAGAIAGYVVLGGVLHTVKLAHFRLAYSRKMFLVAYPREAQGMALDAHNKPFAAFGGVPKRDRVR